jgi:hypothetical protein
MALPTQAELYAETDRQFAAQHPEAPQRLDPDDPAQASLVTAWLAIRDELLNAWTDQAFYEFFPSAGRLDPANPEDSTLIEYWRDIQQQIVTTEQGRWNWAQPQPAPLEVLSVEQDPVHGGFVLVFSRPVEVDEGGTWLFNGPLPVGTTVERRADSALGVRLTLDGLRQMREEVARQIEEAGILTAD